MKSLNEILTKKKIAKVNMAEFGNSCAEDLIANGYIHSPVFGWERIEIIERFNLNPDLEGVPCILYPERDYKEIAVSDKDESGKPTGGKKVIRTWYETGKMFWGAVDNYLAYLQFKKDRWAKYDAEDYAKKVNNPPMADEYYN